MQIQDFPYGMMAKTHTLTQYFVKDRWFHVRMTLDFDVPHIRVEFDGVTVTDEAMAAGWIPRTGTLLLGPAATRRTTPSPTGSTT